MILSRRSFLKVAGLSAVAVAGASMFTGCSGNIFTTPVEYIADAADANDDTVKKVVEALNKSKAATSILGGSDLHNTKDQDKTYFTNLIGGLALNDKSTGYDKVEVKGTKLSESLNKEGKCDHYYVEVTIGKKTENK